MVAYFYLQYIYIGRTIQRLEIRVKSQVSRELLRRSQSTTSGFSPAQESVIGDHQWNHYICRIKYSDDRFFVLYKAWSKKQNKTNKKKTKKKSRHFRSHRYHVISPYLGQTEKTILYSWSVWGTSWKSRELSSF